MKIRYTIKLEAESKEEAMGLAVINNQFRDLFAAHITNSTLPPADVRLLLIPGKFS